MLKKQVIDYFGGTTATARALKVSKSTVSLWEAVIPWKYALLIEKLTKKKLKFEPSLYAENVNTILGGCKSWSTKTPA